VAENQRGISYGGPFRNAATDRGGMTFTPDWLTMLHYQDQFVADVAFLKSHPELEKEMRAEPSIVTVLQATAKIRGHMNELNRNSRPQRSTQSNVR